MKTLRRAIHIAYPWLVISLCALFLFYKYILQVSPSVMTNSLMRFFHIHAAGLGNLAATFFYAYLFVQILAGPLLDKYSPRKLMTVAIFICAIGTLIFSLANALWIAIIGRMLVGVGAAFATVGYMKMASIYFPPHRFALIGGLLATAAMIGAILGETPLAILVQDCGWQHCLYYIAIAGLTLAVIFYLVVQDKKDTAFLDASSPDGLHLNRKDFVSILKKKHNWILAFYSGMAFAPVAVFGGLWGNPFIREVYHVSKISAADYISLIFMGLAVGGPVLGWLSDKYNNRITMMAFGSSLSLVSLLLIVYLSLPLMLLGTFLFTFGFGTGAFMLGFAMGKDTNPAILAGTVIALINTGDAIFGAITEPFVGKLLDVFWQGKVINGVHFFSVQSYQKALSVLLCYLFLSLVLTAVLKNAKTKGKLMLKQ